MAIPPVPVPETTVDTVTMVFIGDVMMHSGQLRYDSSDFLAELGPLLSGADISVANAEFTMAGPPYTGYPAFSAPDDYASNVTEHGVDVLLTANNHILDKGSAGMRRTLDILPVPFTGSGRDGGEFESLNPLVLSCKGLRIALVNFTYGTNMVATSAWPAVNYMNRERISAQIARARKAGADFVIALPHWGTEYRLNPDGEQLRWADFLVECGVDAIVGAHPHVVQDTTFIKGVPVIYSMGNAVSNMSAPNTRLELAVVLRMTNERPFGKKELLRPELRFLWCTLPGRLKRTYCTIEVDKYLDKRNMWLTPSDWDDMVATLGRVKAQTGIE